MKKRIGFWGIFVLCDLVLLRPCGAETSGTAGFSFLNILPGARATAMGQAFTTVPNDIQALNYNPATLTSLVVSQASFQHLTYVADVDQEALAYGHAGRDQELSWGLLSNYLRVGNVERTVATLSTSGDGFTDAGTFSTYDMMLGAAVAAPLWVEGLSAGTTLKFLRESLSDASSNAGALDLGLLYQGNVERSWNIGAVVQNLGFASKFADAAVNLPWTLRAGLSGQPFAQWLLSVDGVKRRDTQGEIDVGAEVTPRRFISLRVGYRYAATAPDLGGLSNFGAGIGFRWNTISLDYAYIPLGDLGTTHRVSLNVRFKTQRS